MLYDILSGIEILLQHILIYVAIYLVKKYIFLEPDLEKEKQRWYHIASILLIAISYVFLKDNTVFILLLSAAICISWARKEHKIIGFFLIIPMIGLINGIIVPLLSTPTTILNIHNEEYRYLIYSIIIYLILFIAIGLFYFKAKKWRIQFDKDLENRHLECWERVLISIVGGIMMVYSSTYSTLPSTSIANQAVIDAIIIDKVVTALSIFCLTITVVVVILQGNKKAFYHKKTMNMSKQMVKALANTIDAKDTYTNGHSTRVAKYSVMLAQRMGYDGEKLEQLEMAALLHDIGKIGVPREIINKPSRLTDEEYAIIKTHPGIGADILMEVEEIPDIAIGAKWHHERFDGKGYPDKLVGNSIPEIARIIGVADAYDAMTSKRSYRDVLAQEIVKGEIEKGMGTQFDPDIAKIMIELINEDKEYTMHE